MMRTESNIRKIMPVDLLLEDRPCLVVGGGPIAARKVGHLLDAGARVTVVSAAAIPAILDWKKMRLLRHRPHDFRDSDLRGQFLVFAATNDPAVNDRIMRLCRRGGILASSADDGWTQGDFVTPATFRSGRLTLTVSTGGQSCRRARLSKDCLGRHVGLLDTAELLTMGMARPRGLRADFLGAVLHRFWGVHEFMILDRPDRIEVLAVVARDAVLEKMLKEALATAGRARGRVQARRGVAALAHTVRLFAAGGDGVGTMKASMDHSLRSGWAGAMMKQWVGVAQCSKAKQNHQRQYELILRGFQGRDPVE